jgi:hypothetical protein
LVVGACKPDEAKIRHYLPSQFSEVKIQESMTFPFICTSMVFFAIIDRENVAKVPGIKRGPISSNIPDNSAAYRVFSNAGRSCPLTSFGNAGVRILSDYIDAEGIFFIEPAAGRLVIFDPARNIIVFLEG